ncbi:helix-turn-helix domain-containing protein [Streptomyces cellulosae]|uniref:Transposase family protein n=1 Tax=Streptomyces cellulosae TaxID=1968 RepID=A0ABW7YIG6_STRCE
MVLGRLLITLTHLRHGATHNVLACWFGVDRSTITRAVGENSEPGGACYRRCNPCRRGLGSDFLRRRPLFGVRKVYHWFMTTEACSR